MATAKTPKKTPAAAPATVGPKRSAGERAANNPAARAAAPKRVPARAAVAKPVEEAVVHSAEIVAEQNARAANAAAEQTAKVTDAAAERIAEASEAVTEQVAKAAKAAEVVTTPSRAVAVAEKTAGDARDSVMKGVVSFLDYGRDHAILLVATGNELALGLHKMSRSLIDWSAESCDKSVAAGQAMLSAKSVEEIVDLSRSLAQDGLDQLLKESSELTALSHKLIEDAIVPLPGRLIAAVEKLASHAA